jgi:hypothetical protein
MNSLFLALALKPLLLLVLAAIILTPARMAVERWLPEGRLKRALLYRVNDARY